MSPGPEQLARSYVAWLRRHARGVIAAHVAVLAIAGYLIAFHLPLFADFSYLLPKQAPAVKDLRRLESRVKATDTVLVVIQAPTPEVRAEVVRDMAAAIRTFPHELVDAVEEDDVEIRDYLRAHKFLFVPLRDLEKARDALAHRIERAKLEANPLYVDIDDHAADDAAAKRDLDALRKQRRDAEARLDHSNHVSGDGKIAMIEVRIAFPTTDAHRGGALIARLGEASTRLVAAHPGLTMGFTGGIITAVSEHTAIENGIVLSSIVTAVLVALVLALYFRSATLLVLLVGTIGIATAAAFGARGGHRRPPQRRDGVPRRDHRGQRDQLRHLADRAVPRRAPALEVDVALAGAIVGDAAADRDRLARRVDRVWLARRDQLQGLRRLRGDRCDRHARVLDRELRAVADAGARIRAEHADLPW